MIATQPALTSIDRDITAAHASDEKEVNAFTRCPDCAGPLTVRLGLYRGKRQRRYRPTVLWACKPCMLSTLLKQDLN